MLWRQIEHVSLDAAEEAAPKWTVKRESTSSSSQSSVPKVKKPSRDALRLEALTECGKVVAVDRLVLGRKLIEVAPVDRVEEVHQVKELAQVVVERRACRAQSNSPSAIADAMQAG